MVEIPKVLHYCWFGGKSLPDRAKQTIKGWHELMPDYEIVRWDESNFDVAQCAFVRGAYEARKWAFVSDYARLKVTYEYGGTYMDVGSKLLRPIDSLARGKGFAARDWEACAVNPGLVLSASVHCDLLGETLDAYEQLVFEDSTEFLYEHTVNNMFARTLEKYGYVSGDDVRWEYDGFVVYPSEYFCPKLDFGGFRTTENTYSTHTSSASWLPEGERFRVAFVNRWAPCLGDFIARKLARVLKIVRYRSY